MDTRALRAIKAICADIPPEQVDRPHMSEMAATMADEKRAYLSCTSMVTVDIELKICHGFALVLRNLKWLAKDQAVSYPLLVRSVLEALSVNTR